MTQPTAPIPMANPNTKMSTAITATAPYKMIYTYIHGVSTYRKCTLYIFVHSTTNYIYIYIKPYLCLFVAVARDEHDGKQEQGARPEIYRDIDRYI